MRLRLANAVVYGLLATFAAAALAGRLRSSFGAVVSPWSYAPSLRYPALWLALAASLAVLVFLGTRRLLLGERIGLRLYVALLAIVASSVAATRLVPPARRPPASEVLDHLVARAEAAVDAAWARERRYPADAAPLEEAIPETLREPGFRARPGTLLRSAVHAVPSATGPVLAAPDGVRPGDVVYAVDADRRRYWLTAFTLDARGRVRPRSAAGKVLVAAGVEGRASVQRDPLFPDYPNKSSGRARPTEGAGQAPVEAREAADAGIPADPATPNPVDGPEPHSGATTRDRPSRSP